MTPLLAIILLSSCSKKDVSSKCLDHNNLSQYASYYPGLETDTIVFVKNDNSETYFVIRNKSLVEYQSECGCSNLNVFLSNASDSIFLEYNNINDEYFAELNYRPSKMSFKSKVSDSHTFLADHNISREESVYVGDSLFQEVLVFTNPNGPNTDDQSFKRVVMAKKYGIIQMEKHNGEILTAKDLATKENYDLSSFQLQQATCN